MTLEFIERAVGACRPWLIAISMLTGILAVSSDLIVSALLAEFEKITGEPVARIQSKPRPES